MSEENTIQGPTVFGHPAGLFTLFFAEMWERFSYYGMRALLIFYMIKGFMGLNDNSAYAIYGAYTALVYMTPFFGGMLADKILGRRRAVVLGGLLMAAGHMLMMVEQTTPFFVALALLIAGNGFFKPNISTIVGELYPKVSQKKDAGFTLFYMGINLGAAMAPIVCGYVGETHGWHWGFGLATIGMLIGVAVFVAPIWLNQILIGGGALATAIAMPFWQDTTLQLGVRIVMSIMLLIAAGVAVLALQRGGLPKTAGAPPDLAKLKRKILGPLSAEWVIYLGTIPAVVALSFIVQKNAVAGWVMNITGLLFLGYMLREMIFRCTKVARERLSVVLILFFFVILFWAFFEQAGSSLNNWTDRNIDRAFGEREITKDDVGTEVSFRIPIQVDSDELKEMPILSQEQLGQVNDSPAMKAAIGVAIRKVEADRNKKRIEADKLSAEDIDSLVEGTKSYDVLTMTGLSALRTIAGEKDAPREDQVVVWKVAESNVGMGIADSEIPASEFQAANPIYILLFGLVLTGLWAFLAARGLDPSTPVKFALGMGLLGLSFVIFWYGAGAADARGMSTMSWILLGYLVLTIGELCLSPVGLSMVTKLSPAHMVSGVMGGYFLATAFSNYIAGIIATFTGVGHGDGKAQVIPPPVETSKVYGDVFGLIGAIAIGAAVCILLLSPLLTKWMHIGVDEDAA